MCDHGNGTHVTLGLAPFGEARCVLCGHRVSYGRHHKLKLRLRDWPGEIKGRIQAKHRWWNSPDFQDGIFYY